MKSLVTIPTETCIPLGEFKTVYSTQRVYIRVHDQAAGPYLAIEGVNDKPDSEESATEFYFQTIEEINEFAKICRSILKKAQRAEAEVDKI